MALPERNLSELWILPSCLGTPSSYLVRHERTTLVPFIPHMAISLFSPGVLLVLMDIFVQSVHTNHIFKNLIYFSILSSSCCTHILACQKQWCFITPTSFPAGAVLATSVWCLDYSYLIFMTQTALRNFPKHLYLNITFDSSL